MKFALPLLAATCLIAASAQATELNTYDNVVDSYSKFYYKDGENQVKSDWKVRGGAGLIAGPEYEGSDEYTAIPIPYISVEYKDTLFADTVNGLGVNIVRQEGFTGGAKLRYRFGREEDISSHLRGTGDVDDWAELGFFLRQEFGITGGSKAHLTGEFNQDITGGVDNGYSATVGADYQLPVAEHANASVGLNTTYISDDYAEALFGVNALQSARSGLARYSADAGFKDVTLITSANWAYEPEWMLVGNLGYKYLLNDVADSPIVQDESQYFGGVSVIHAF